MALLAVSCLVLKTRRPTYPLGIPTNSDDTHTTTRQRALMHIRRKPSARCGRILACGNRVVPTRRAEPPPSVFVFGRPPIDLGLAEFGRVRPKLACAFGGQSKPCPHPSCHQNEFGRGRRVRGVCFKWIESHRDYHIVLIFGNIWCTSLVRLTGCLTHKAVCKPDHIVVGAVCVFLYDVLTSCSRVIHVTL